MTKFSKLSKFLAITTITLSATAFFSNSRTFASCNYNDSNRPICQPLNEAQVDKSLKSETVEKFKQFVKEKLDKFSEQVRTYKKNNPNKDQPQMNQNELEKTTKEIKIQLNEMLANNTATPEEIKAAINIVSDCKPLNDEGINLVIKYFDLVRVIFIEAGGGFGCPDPVKFRKCNAFEGCLGTPGGKMNDAAVLKAYFTMIMLDNYVKYGTLLPGKNLKPLETPKRIFPILGIKPDNSIKIPEHLKEKLNTLNYMLSDIKTVPATGKNIGKGLDNQIYDTYPGASSYHYATTKFKNVLDKTAKELGISNINFLRESFQTGDTCDRKHRTPCVMMHAKDIEALKFASLWALLANYRLDSQPRIEFSGMPGMEIPQIFIEKDNENYERWVPRTWKDGITTLLNWKITDTIDLQAAALDEKVIWHEAILEALAIARYCFYSPRVSNVLLELIKETDSCNETIVKGIRISVNISGEDIENISEGSLVIRKADQPTKKLEIKGKIEKSNDDNKYYLTDDKKQNEFNIQIKELDENLDWKKETDNEYYLNVYAKHNDKISEEEIPCPNVCSFKIKPKDRYFIENSTLEHERLENTPVIETNTVTQKSLQDKIKNQQQQTISELKPSPRTNNKSDSEIKPVSDSNELAAKLSKEIDNKPQKIDSEIANNTTESNSEIKPISELDKID